MSDKQCKACGDDLFITKFDYHHYCAEEELDRLRAELEAAREEIESNLLYANKDANDQLRAANERINTAEKLIKLLNSMVLCGEEHSDRSRNEVHTFIEAIITGPEGGHNDA